MNPRLIQFPPIEKHGVIGDRRTAAVVAADGTIDWFCVPDYDDQVVFGALLDPEKGGFCRFGPNTLGLGEQHYEDESACLITSWPNGDAEEKLQLADLMPWPDRKRPEKENRTRVILRRLRTMAGDARVSFELRPRWNFEQVPRVKRSGGGVRFEFGEFTIMLWTNFEVETDADAARAAFTLWDGEEAWAMIGLDEAQSGWDAARCRELHERTNQVPGATGSEN